MTIAKKHNVARSSNAQIEPEGTHQGSFRPIWATNPEADSFPAIDMWLGLLSWLRAQ
jgi:hypothetical protein